MINSSSNKNLYSLPNEMFWEISKFLNFKDIIAFAKTCKCYYNELKKEKFWKEQLKKFNFEDLESRLNIKNITLESLLKDLNLYQKVLIVDRISQLDQKDSELQKSLIIAKIMGYKFENNNINEIRQMAQKYIEENSMNTAMNIANRIINDTAYDGRFIR